MPSRDSISLLALRAFEAAARRLSFTEAARELHITQAAVSRHIRSLESELSRPLFRRLHRRVELTPAGRTFAGALSIGFQHIRRAVHHARGAAAKALRLSVEPAFAARWLVPRLHSFTLAHPEIELQLETSDDFRALGADMDIAIRFLSKESRRRIPAGRRLFSIEGVPVAAPTSSQRTLRSRDPEATRFFCAMAAGRTGVIYSRGDGAETTSLVLVASAHSALALAVPINDRRRRGQQKRVQPASQLRESP